MNNSSIKHVIVLILENRSFDQIFGYRSKYNKPFQVNGIDFDNLKFNLDKDGNKIYQNCISAFSGEDDSVHDLKASLCCINGLKEDDCDKMSGFVLANQLLIKDPENRDNTFAVQPNEIMGYFPENSFPVFEYIANNFIVCDNWFSSVPTCTQPNRAFALCGKADGHIDNLSKGIDLKLFYHCDTIFDQLNSYNIDWKIYYNDFPNSLLLSHQLYPKNLRRFTKFSEFQKDVKNNKLPKFCFIEPEYGIESSGKKIEDIMNGQVLVYELIKTLQSNKNIWNSCLLSVFYDENGGFYDHVYPPKAPSPEKTEIYSYDQYGCRVPAMLISPLIDKGVDSTLYDHTSVLATIEKLWNMEPLTERDRNANNFCHLILPSPRDDIPKLIKDFEITKMVETSIRNRKHDFEFFQSFVERNLIYVFAEVGEILYLLNRELYHIIKNLLNKFRKKQ